MINSMVNLRDKEIYNVMMCTWLRRGQSKIEGVIKKNQSKINLKENKTLSAKVNMDTYQQKGKLYVLQAECLSGDGGMKEFN